MNIRDAQRRDRAEMVARSKYAMLDAKLKEKGPAYFTHGEYCLLAVESENVFLPDFDKLNADKKDRLIEQADEWLTAVEKAGYMIDEGPGVVRRV